jgi:hypothetical protein
VNLALEDFVRVNVDVGGIRFYLGGINRTLAAFDKSIQEYLNCFPYSENI